MPREYESLTAASLRRQLKAELRHLDAAGLSVHGPLSGNDEFVHRKGRPLKAMVHLHKTSDIHNCCE